MTIKMSSIRWLKSQIQSCFLALGLPVHQILAKSFTVKILVHAEAHILMVLRPRCADVTTGQIWKSPHIVAATAAAVLTREREISTCLQHIPAPALNNTWLLRELPAAEPRAPGEDPFRCFVREDR